MHNLVALFRRLRYVRRMGDFLTTFFAIPMTVLPPRVRRLPFLGMVLVLGFRKPLEKRMAGQGAKGFAGIRFKIRILNSLLAG